jgi:hypothetical protein
MAFSAVLSLESDNIGDQRGVVLDKERFLGSSAY